MSFLKKIGKGLSKVIKPGGLLSKVVSKIPVIGGLASGAIDVVGGIVQKVSPKSKGTASKKTAGQSFAEAYQNATGVTVQSAAESSTKFEQAAGSPVTGGFIKIGLIIAAVVVGFLLLFKKRR